MPLKPSQKYATFVQPVAAVIMDEAGVPYGIKNVRNKMRVSSMPYAYDIAKENIAGRQAVRRFGHNGDVGTSPETVSHIAAVMYYPAAAEILKIKSDDADDDGAPVGAGARTVWIQGLDDNYEFITDTITMNGTTAVDTNVAFLRVFMMRVITAGASGFNEGTITVYGADGVSKINAIGAEENRAHSASFTVPANQTLYIIGMTIADASLKGAEVTLLVHNFGGLWENARPYVILDNIESMELLMPLKFLEKTDIEIRATALAAGAVVSAGFVGWREDN